MIDAAMRRIGHMIRRAVSLAPTVETGTIQTLQVQYSGFEPAMNILSASHYGFVSVPPPGTDFWHVAEKGDHGGAVAVASNHTAFRPKGWNTGDAGIHDNSGQSVHIQTGGGQIVITANSNVTINAPAVNTSGNLVAGNGASGTFTSQAGNIITVRDGIITNIF